MTINKQAKSIQKQNFTTQYWNYLSKWCNFSSAYYTSFFNSASKSLSALGDEKITMETTNTVRKSFDKIFREELKKEEFCLNLADYLDATLSLSKYFGMNYYYQNFMDIFAVWNTLLEPIRDNINRTPSEIIKMDSGFQLLHYKPIVKKQFTTPILVVYSLINRHYILDLFPNVSVIKSLLEQGFDVYATDWTTPDSTLKNMTLEDHIQHCVGESVKKVLDISGQQKISLFGYCWGGIFALGYAAIRPEKIKNLILHATPVDLGKTDTVIENFTKHIDADNLVDTLGNIPGSLINMAFVLRNPVETVLKYWTFLSKPQNSEDMMKFFAIEGWLYDSRPIMGEIYREIVNKIYKKNMLIKNELNLGSKKINLNNLTMPVLNIVGLKDDLVPPESSKHIMDHIPSNDKQLIEFPTGHVGLCISKKAHEKLWPQVGKWLGKRS